MSASLTTARRALLIVGSLRIPMMGLRTALRVLPPRKNIRPRWQSRTLSSQSQPNQRPPGVTWFSLAGTGCVLGAAYGVYQYLEKEKTLEQSLARINAFTEAGIGRGDWKLTDQSGKLRAYSEFRGKWLMLYFGFCHCPDICPEELEKLIAVVKGIDQAPETPSIQPIFITLDPDRDTVSFMKKYCQDFSENLIGMTGTGKEIDDVAKRFRVYYSIGDKDEDGDYIVDHTICMYLINPDGELVDVYERRIKEEGIIQGTINHMREHNKLKGRISQTNNS